eukprot:GHVH01004328.1.p1 GENE.GHVH01004328.1~~GHVH01004328.1.p1  ORF type:complete len:419 (+),score=47.07 GHVH01004328.1:58-1314(+)
MAKYHHLKKYLDIISTQTYCLLLHTIMESPKLTQHSTGGGCGCKISPKDLEKILTDSGKTDQTDFPCGQLLVGHNTKDDAAVMEIHEDGLCVVSTTDFFMPVVDDPFDFGRISATNAISDIYAMGARPCIAISILGWPMDKLSSDHASMVIRGAREVCKNAGIPLAGGHSIISKEPIFGLAVTGKVQKKNILTNGSSCRVGDLLYLTKPLGVGILSKAAKSGLLGDEAHDILIRSMTCLNSVGVLCGEDDNVSISGMTDVTGFGLLGHLCEMTEAADETSKQNGDTGVRCIVNYDHVPTLHPSVVEFVTKEATSTGGSVRNWDSYGHKVNLLMRDSDQKKFSQSILTDPQTSGGLLIAVSPDDALNLEKLIEPFIRMNVSCTSSQEKLLKPIGRFVAPAEFERTCEGAATKDAMVAVQ